MDDLPANGLAHTACHPELVCRCQLTWNSLLCCHVMMLTP
jgi:hypothetical protein